MDRPIHLCLYEHPYDALFCHLDKNPALLLIAGVSRRKIQRESKINLQLILDIQEIFLNVNRGSSV